MTRSTIKILVAGAAIAVATIFATQHVLSLFPSGTDATQASEEASFLAHLLLPLSVTLLIFVVIAAIGGVVRLVRALLGYDSGEEPGPEP
ncbi:MAG: hypothetical protein P8R42_18915 [Candidatus Binatia bacterium]|nr:hypothetical protein [Candidatus Binatia bacterium]